MINAKSHFNDEQLKLLKSIDVELSDNIDYSDDKLIEIHGKLCDADLIYFNNKGEPTQTGLIFESIIDIFHDEFDV